MIKELLYKNFGTLQNEDMFNLDKIGLCYECKQNKTMMFKNEASS